MTSITRIDFITIPTLDEARTAAFYRDVLGLEESPATVDTPHSEFDLGGTGSGTLDFSIGALLVKLQIEI